MPKLFFRWIKNESQDLDMAKEKKLVYTENGKPSNKARWLFEEGATYQAGTSILKDRTLVVFDFGEDGAETIKNKDNQIDFESGEFKGEAQHPDKVITKSNEQGAYGVGKTIISRLKVVSTRLATKKEVARALSLNEMEVKEQKW